MYLTKETLLQYVWDHHDRFWTMADVNRLIRRKLIKTHRLGGRKVFKTEEVETYFDEEK